MSNDQACLFFIAGVTSIVSLFYPEGKFKLIFSIIGVLTFIVGAMS